VKTEEGGLIPSCRRGSNHIDSELEAINKEMQYDLFRQLMDELLEHKKKPIIFMAPIPRYLEEGCCEDRDHVSNRPLISRQCGSFETWPITPPNPRVIKFNHWALGEVDF
jgi:hypothetical protein